MNSREIIKRLQEEGFEFISQKGSHKKFRHPDGRITIVPEHKKDLPKGTLGEIERQTQIKF